LTRFMAAPGLPRLLETSVLIVGVTLFKVFYIAQFLGTIGCVGLLLWLWHRDRRLLRLLACVCLTIIPVMFLIQHGLRNDLQRLSFHLIPIMPPPLSFQPITLGMRLLAFPALLRALRWLPSPSEPHLFMAVFILLGAVAGLTVGFGPTNTCLRNGFWTF